MLAAARICCAWLAVAAPAQAAGRVFVSVTGSDTNDCANVTTPCRTLDAAIGQVDAGGEVIVRDTGSYGAMTIAKPVTVDAPSGITALTAATVLVSAGADHTVVLRGLTVKSAVPGVGSGIRFTAGRALHIENCVVDGWQTGIRVIAGGGAKVFVAGTIVRSSSADGFLADASSGARISIWRSRFEGSGQCGVSAAFPSTASVRDSEASGNHAGFCAIEGAQLSVQAAVASGNEIGLLADFGGVVRVSRSLVTTNDVGLQNGSGVLESTGDNMVVGNATDATGTITPVSPR
jgi:hypothetical protein